MFLFCSVFCFVQIENPGWFALTHHGTTMKLLSTDLLSVVTRVPAKQTFVFTLHIVRCVCSGGRRGYQVNVV